jgi:hypothetical protein
MNWYLWFIVVASSLASLVYFIYAAKGKSFEYSDHKSRTEFMLLWSVIGMILLFITTAPLNIFGWLYVIYVAVSTVFFVSMRDRELTFSPAICLLFAVICALWPILILTVGFGA